MMMVLMRMMMTMITTMTTTMLKTTTTTLTTICNQDDCMAQKRNPLPCVVHFHHDSIGAAPPAAASTGNKTRPNFRESTISQGPPKTLFGLKTSTHWMSAAASLDVGPLAYLFLALLLLLLLLLRLVLLLSGTIRDPPAPAPMRPLCRRLEHPLGLCNSGPTS